MDVRRLRRRAGLSQRQLAERTGIAQPNISAYESGRLTPSPATIARVQEATRQRPSELIAAMHAEITALASTYHATDIRVFGSVATGTDTVHSDLDLLVHFTDDATLYDEAGLTHALEELLGLQVDVISDGAPGTEHIAPAVPL